MTEFQALKMASKYGDVRGGGPVETTVSFSGEGFMRFVTAMLAAPTPSTQAAGEPVAWLIERDDALPEATASQEYTLIAERNGARITSLVAAPTPSAGSRELLRAEAK